MSVNKGFSRKCDRNETTRVVLYDALPYGRRIMEEVYIRVVQEAAILVGRGRLLRLLLVPQGYVLLARY